MSDMRATVGETVGRRIDAVFSRVMNDGREQLYFHFDDGTYIEVYGRDMQCSSELRYTPVDELRGVFTKQAAWGRFVEYPSDGPAV